MRRWILAGLGFLASALAVIGFGLCSASPPDGSSLLTLDRIFGSEEFAAEPFEIPRWAGSEYDVLEASKDGRGRDLVRYNPMTGRRRILVSSHLLVPPGRSEPLEVEDYELSADGRRLLIYTDSKKVWRRNTRGDYWVLDIPGRRLRRLGGDAGPSSLMFAKLSPDGRRAAYVRAGDIYVERLEGAGIIRLTEDGSQTVVNGTSDWVYEEELDVRDGFRWSPDGSRIAFWHIDSSEVGEFSMIDNIGSLYPRLTTFRYPKVGTANPSVRIGVVPSDGGEILWFEPPGDPGQHYIARMDWADGSDEVCFQLLNRLQNRLRIMLGDADTGRVRTVLTETDKAWIDVTDDLRWVDGGRSFLWTSERSGWRQIFLVPRSGGEPRNLTPGSFDVIAVEAVDEAGGWVYFTASPDDPMGRFLYRVSLDGSGEAERVTPAGLRGTHSYTLSPDGHWSFHSQSSFDEPTTTELIRIPGHDHVRTLQGNERLRSLLGELSRSPVEFFRVDIGPAVLDGWCMKPPDFDPGKKYPLLFYVYGEPAGSTVVDRWGGNRYLWHLMLAQKGYLVMSIDNRGTAAPRGREWRKSIYRRVGILACEDQSAALRRILEERPFIDPERVGIWGWSGGGSMSLNMIFRYPDLYSAAVAVAFVSDQLLYDTVYQERYMGLPRDNEEGYRDGSPITHAGRLEGNLLLIHGTGDDNVHYQSFERLVDELIRNNKVFSMMVYPNRTHSISEGENTTRHLYEVMTNFLLEKLSPGPAE